MFLSKNTRKMERYGKFLLEVVFLKKDINMEIGQRVRSARKKANLTRESLAEKLNVSTLFISYIECGQKGMSLETLRKLCQVLQTSSDYILLGRDNSEISRNNLHLLVDSVDIKYCAVVEDHLQCLLRSINRLEQIARSSEISEKNT